MLRESCTKNKIEVANLLLMQAWLSIILLGLSLTENRGMRWDGKGNKEKY
jgi:hypothetical protein